MARRHLLCIKSCWRFEDKGQLGVDFCSKISFRKTLFSCTCMIFELVVKKGHHFAKTKFLKNIEDIKENVDNKKHFPKLMLCNENKIF